MINIIQMDIHIDYIKSLPPCLVYYNDHDFDSLFQIIQNIFETNDAQLITDIMYKIKDTNTDIYPIFLEYCALFYVDIHIIITARKESSEDSSESSEDSSESSEDSSESSEDSYDKYSYLITYIKSKILTYKITGSCTKHITKKHVLNIADDDLLYKVFDIFVFESNGSYDKNIFDKNIMEYMFIVMINPINTMTNINYKWCDLFIQYLDKEFMITNIIRHTNNIIRCVDLLNKYDLKMSERHGYDFIHKYLLSLTSYLNKKDRIMVSKCITKAHINYDMYPAICKNKYSINVLVFGNYTVYVNGIRYHKTHRFYNNICDVLVQYSNDDIETLIRLIKLGYYYDDKTMKIAKELGKNKCYKYLSECVKKNDTL
jgi:hypothetical protein